MSAIIDRIKKLLRLGADQRGNAHEAERAMALAFELAERHRVDVSSLDLEEETAKIVWKHIHVGGRLDTLRRGVIGLLQTFFHVTCCLQSPRMLLVGKSEDIAIASYVHDFLLRAGRACLRAYEVKERAGRRRMTTAKRTGYMQGFIYGITTQLRRSKEVLALDDSHTALVVSEKAARNAKLDELAPDRVTVKPLKNRHNENAVTAGWIDGKATNISQPLGGGKQEVLAR